MEIYFLTAVSIFLTSAVVTFLFLVYHRRARNMTLPVFLTSFIGSSLGVFLSSKLGIHQLERLLAIILQNLFSFFIALVVTFIFLYLQFISINEK